MDTSTHPPAARPHEVPSAQDLLPAFLHDLNNYLGIILGNAELLLDADSNPEKRSKRTQAIYTTAIRTKDLILDLQEKL